MRHSLEASSRSRAAARSFLLGVILWATAISLPSRAAPDFEIGLNFTGATMEDTFSFPPDTMGGVSDEYIFEVVNRLVQVYRKSDGVRVWQRRTLRFWSDLGFAPHQLHGDSRVVYDASSGRWILVALDGFDRPNRYLLAVSHGTDPRQGWVAFAIDSDATGLDWADFPILGIDAEAIYVWADLWEIGGCCPTGGSLLVFPKADLLAPVPTISAATYFDIPYEVGWTPVINLDETGLPTTLLRVNPSRVFPLLGLDIVGDAYSPGFGDQWGLWLPYSYPPNAEQPGPLRNLETSGWFSSAPVKRNGKLWVVHEVQGENGRSAVRFLKIDPMSRTVLQEVIIGDEELDLYYASIAVNEDEQVVVGFSGSSELQYVSAYAAVGETVDGITEFSEPILLKGGVADYQWISAGRNRWGDYSATVVDPSDPHAFWTFQEFVVGPSLWGTQITQIRVPPKTVEVTIDVRPESEQNPINVESRGVVPVALAGSDTFDVSDVDATTLAFGPGGSPLAHRNGPHPGDVVGDDHIDLLAHFETEQMGIARGDEEACLTGELLDGTRFRGCDVVRTVPEAVGDLASSGE